jgi:ATP-dependent DNA helicase HFM1/MER3
MFRAKCLQAEMWENSPNVLAQLEGVGPAKLKALKSVGIRSFEDLENAEITQLEQKLGRALRNVNDLKSLGARFPRVDVAVHRVS